MASAEQIKALIRNHVAGNDAAFYAVAMQVAAQAARQGHGRVATEIKDLIDEARVAKQRRSGMRPVPPTLPKGELSGLLAVTHPETRLADMVLDQGITFRLRRVLREQKVEHKLGAYGLSPRRKILLVGPPGSGKTMTAAALAGELHLPLFVILLHGLITKFMGETASKLRLVFDALAEHRGVYLFDEFDAIGSERAVGNDVGEIRRILNSFLQFLEQDESRSIIVAATNHPQALDKALFRRFDDVIDYGMPPAEKIQDVLRNKLSAFDTSAIDWTSVTEEASDLSYADLTRAAEAAAKEAILEDSEGIAMDELLTAIRERKLHGKR